MLENKSTLELPFFWLMLANSSVPANTEDRHIAKASFKWLRFSR